ncbi:MAG: hypothetical protein HKP58_19135, partial [Desulfatitalea sp.]|nr:FAD-dependent oxidoreductase [Desulfatitalea sp.]NNK02530.1 hypothetical protein [Desulfatitalea sp.]
DTESARDYVLRTVNAEINDYLCEPMVRTMLLANSNKASKVEFFSALANGFGNRFLYLNGGLNRFARDLAQHLDIRLQSPATRVADHGDHVAVTWQTQGLDPETQKATACVVSCPLPVANRICEGYAAILQPLNEKLDYTQSIAVGIGSTVVPDARAFLVQLSSRESKEIAVLVLEHNKASNLAPEGHGMITALWETDAATRYLAKDDATIIAKTLETVFKVFPEIKGYVDVTHVTRWPLALPFTQVGAYRAIDAFNARINPASRVQFAADFMSAAGQNTAVEFGTRAARTIDSAFGK